MKYLGDKCNLSMLDGVDDGGIVIKIHPIEPNMIPNDVISFVTDENISGIITDVLHNKIDRECSLPTLKVGDDLYLCHTDGYDPRNSIGIRFYKITFETF